MCHTKAEYEERGPSICRHNPDLELCPSLKSVSEIVYVFFIPSVDFRRCSIRVLKFSFVMIVMKPSKNFPFF